jgi:hypothetical protein
VFPKQRAAIRRFADRVPEPVSDGRVLSDPRRVRDERFATSAFPLDTPCRPFAASFRPAVSDGATTGSPRRGTG